MEPSKVYFTDMRARPGTSLQQKLEKLMRRAGFETIDFKDKYAAIKIHFGEPGNLSFLRPNFAKTVADMVKAQGGKPFLTDCNTLYVGRLRMRWTIWTPPTKTAIRRFPRAVRLSLQTA